MELVGKKGGGGGGEKKEKPAAKAPPVEAPAKPSGPSKKAPPAKVSVFILLSFILKRKDLKQFFFVMFFTNRLQDLQRRANLPLPQVRNPRKVQNLRNLSRLSYQYVSNLASTH